MSHLSWLPSALLSRWEETLPCSVPASYSEFVSGETPGTYISITTIPPRYLPLLTNDWTQGRAWRCGRSCNTHPYLHLPFLMQSQLCLSLCILLPVCVCVCVCVRRLVQACVRDSRAECLWAFGSSVYVLGRGAPACAVCMTAVSGREWGHPKNLLCSRHRTASFWASETTVDRGLNHNNKQFQFCIIKWL